MFITYLSFDATSTLVNSVITSLLGQNSIDTIFCYFILAIITFLAFINEPKIIKFNVIAFAIFLILIFMFDNLLHAENEYYVSEITSSVRKAFLGYFYIQTVTDENIIIKSFRPIAYITFFSLFFQPFWSGSIIFESSSNGEFASGYMNFAYKMLPCIILFLYLYFKERKKIDLILFIISIVEVFIFGNRGAILAVIVFLFLYILFCMKFTKKIIALSGISVATVAILYILNNKLLDIYNWVYSHGYSSRLLSRLISGEAYESGREQIYTLLLEVVQQWNPLGYGISGDRSLLYSAFGVPYYAHNLFLELIIQFGSIFGILISIYLIINWLKIFLRRDIGKWKEIFIVVFSIIIPKLMVSSSFWVESYFFVLLGMMSVIRRIKLWKNKKILIKKEFL